MTVLVFLLGLMALAFTGAKQSWLVPAVRAEPAAAAADPALLEEKAKGILAEHCGSCHSSDVSRAKPAALKVFDLQEKGWQARMTDGQLRKLLGRMESFGAPQRERRIIAKFVDEELRRRAPSR